MAERETLFEIYSKVASVLAKAEEILMNQIDQLDVQADTDVDSGDTSGGIDGGDTTGDGEGGLGGTSGLSSQDMIRTQAQVQVFSIINSMGSNILTSVGNTYATWTGNMAFRG